MAVHQLKCLNLSGDKWAKDINRLYSEKEMSTANEAAADE